MAGASAGDVRKEEMNDYGSPNDYRKNLEIAQELLKGAKVWGSSSPGLPMLADAVQHILDYLKTQPVLQVSDRIENDAPTLSR